MPELSPKNAILSGRENSDCCIKDADALPVADTIRQTGFLSQAADQKVRQLFSAFDMSRNY